MMTLSRSFSQVRYLQPSIKHRNFRNTYNTSSAGVKMVISSVATSPLIEMDAFMHIPRKFLAPIGIFTVVKNNRKQFVVKILFYLSFLNLGLCVLGEMIFFVLSFARNQGDFIQSTYLILCIGFILISFAKVIALISKLDTLHKLMDELSDIFPKTKAEQADYKVAECLQQTRWILKWYGVVQIFMIWSFSLVPQMSTITNYLQHGNWTVEFSYTIWYPIDPYQRGLFELFYVSQFWAAFCAAMGILSVDVVMCSIVMLICMNFDHLSNSFLNLKPSNSRRDIALLKDYVITHNKVIKCVSFIHPDEPVHDAFSHLQLCQGVGRHFQLYEFVQFCVEFGGDLCRWIFVHLLEPNHRSTEIRILPDDLHAANLHRLLDGRSHH